MECGREGRGREESGGGRGYGGLNDNEENTTKNKLLIKNKNQPWKVWISGLSTNLRTKGSLVRFPVRARAWVMGQVPSRGYVRGNHTLMFFSSLFLPPYPCLKIYK